MARIRYFCSCPDFTKQQSFLLNSTFESHLETRNWSDSGAGVDEGQYCKHIWAVKLMRGEVSKSEIPTDIPLAPTERESEVVSKERYKQGYGGNDFSGGWDVAQPSKYRGG
jgi:hypothetical protein